MRVAVFTSITAGKDSLKDPLCWEGADWYLFTDEPRVERGWDVQPACEIFKDPRRNSRAPKILAHQYLPNYAYTLWLDGCMRLQVPVRDLIDQYLADADVAFFRHDTRDCIYDEGRVCEELRLDSADKIGRQLDRYRSAGYPAHAGLGENRLILRRRTPRVMRFNEVWWAEYCRHTCRDQLSAMYALQLAELRPAWFPGTAYDNPGIALFEGHSR